MNNPIRILHLEDNPRDAELVRSSLLDAGFDCRITHVQTSKDFEAALEKPDYDLILSDHTLPGDGGLSALKTAREKAPEVPFLFVSGAIGAEAAIDGLLNGASDYVLKNNLERLAPAVRRALEKKINRRWAEGDERLAMVVRDSNDALTIQDFKGNITAWNHGAELMYGYDEEEALKMNIGRLTPPEKEAEQKDFTRRLMEGEEISSFETQRVAKDGRLLDVWLTVTKLIDDTGQPVEIASTARDITERKNSELKLRLSEERYSTLFENARDGMALANLETGRLVDCNRALCLMVERDKVELLGQPQSILHPPENCADGVAGTFLRHRKGEAPLDVEDVLLSKNGHRVPVEIRATRIQMRGSWFLLGNFRDMTVRNRLQEQIVQSQKMEAVGRLAGGVAHDFNNLLMAMGGYTELSLRRLETTNPVVPDLLEIKKCVARASSLTRQLLAFSRKQVRVTRIVDLNTVLDDLKDMLKRLIGEDVVFHFMMDSAVGTIDADPAQIEQIVMNLAVNARDAMPKGGQIILTTADVELGPDDVVLRPEIVPGPYVMLAMTDSGSGMDEETQRHIFEPFFTTKEEGKGTGLGLATVYGIVKQSDGYIYAESLPGEGATFRVYFPRVSAPAEEPQASPAPVTTLKGTETILLVEDDTSVRDLGARMLTSFGYTVLEAANAGEALLVCEQHAEPVHLLLTDMIMPKMNGGDLAKRLLSLHPRMRVICMSGSTDPDILRDAMENGMPLLIKPFRSDELARKVREVLEAKEVLR